MKIDPAVTVAAAEASPPAAADARNETTPVNDIFAALLAAVAPAVTADVAPGEAAASAATSDGADASGGANAAGKGETATPAAAAAVLLATLGGALRAAEGGVVAPPIEVPRDARGLPLTPDQAAAGDAAADAAGRHAGQKTLAAGEIGPEGKTLTARPSVLAALAGTSAEEPATLAAGKAGPRAVAGQAPEVPVPATTASDPEATPLDGRPVPPAPGLEAAPAPTAATAPEGQTAHETRTDDAGATPRPATGGQTASPPTTDAAPPPPVAEPRPASWQPSVVAASGAAATEVAGLPGSLEGSATTATAAAGTPSAGGPDAATRQAVDPQRIQAQVLRQVLARQEGAETGTRSLTLQLEPEHLGKVKVQVRTVGEQMMIEFQAESAEAGAALREGRHELVRAIAAQAGRWQQVEVRVTGPEGPAAKTEDQDEERSEDGSHRERDPDERRRERGER